MQQAWTVSELCQHIKLLLDSDELLRFCAVKGEISNVSLYRSGILYLTLKDSGSQISCVMFQSEAQQLKFKPEEGMKVLAIGRVSIFAGRSQYQLVIQALQPDGIGELYTAFLQLKEKLEKEGLFESARKRPIPFFPKRIGVVTSLHGAAIHDMISIMKRRNPTVQIVVSPSQVQGPEAPYSLIAALRRLEEVPGIEAIIIGRGGGSPEELAAFNDEALAREISRCPVPIISAVGHETDFTIADFVADKRAPTPSAAAELIAPHSFNLMQHLSQLYERLRTLMINRLEAAETRLEALIHRPIFRFPLEPIERENQKLDMLSNRLEERFATNLRLTHGKLENLSHQLDALNPVGVLKRGYALISKNGKIITSAEEAAKAKKIQLTFHDGHVTAIPEPKISKIALQESLF